MRQRGDKEVMRRILEVKKQMRRFRQELGSDTGIADIQKSV